MDEVIERPSARILLADEHDRVLLFLDKFGDQLWFTPGGGIDPGESVAEAAARELAEETGLVVPVAGIGPVVAVSSGYWRGDWDGRIRRSTDSYHFVRTASFTPDTSGFTDYERDFIAEHRWWPLEELTARAADVVPWGLPELLARLFAGEVPAEPVELPWHHPDIRPE